MSAEHIADKLKVKPQRILDWENGSQRPTVRQGRRLAHIYERPFLEFLSTELPSVAEVQLVPDFRRQRRARSSEDEIGLATVQRWAEQQRLNALDLYELLGISVPKLPEVIYSGIEKNPETEADRIRDVLRFPLERQTSLKSKDRIKFPSILRALFESVGVLVLKDGRLSKVGVRGMCLYEPTLPVIVYTNEAPTGQAFTLCHEFAHVLVKESAISGPPGVRHAKSREDRIERWCNAFAAAFLIPSRGLASLLPRPDKPAPNIDDNVVADIAKRFAVSEHALMIRLITLAYVQPEYYWNTKRSQYLARDSDYQGVGRSTYYGSRFRNANGDLFTGLVLEAWNSGRLSNHNAAEFMGIKNPRHLSEIRENFIR